MEKRETGNFLIREELSQTIRSSRQGTDVRAIVHTNALLNLKSEKLRVKISIF